ncbi:MAG: hypothetical protein ACJ71A_13925, partial [Nitrososphaeraceae archaeon]
TNLGTEVIQHSGGIDGYSTYLGFNPTKQEGVVLLCSCETKDMPSPVIESLIKLKIHYFSRWYIDFSRLNLIT